MWDLPEDQRPREAAVEEETGQGGQTPPEVDEVPLGSGEVRAHQGDRIQVWKRWVLGHNPKLTDQQAESIVRWVLKYSLQYNVNHKLIFALIKWESWFDPGCVSHAGAIGLMQLMPGTARSLGVDPWKVEENIAGGVHYLAEQLATFADRPVYERVVLALACYNAGPNAVRRAGGVPDIPETQRYVRKVSTTFRELHEAGFP
ncbi:MAG: lytic transglycosylase domain-containing protein [Armatimonadetes bacterium]|nr:lytic transglycosylase domain-containing protein [Armatimonadota bacterium]